MLSAMREEHQDCPEAHVRHTNASFQQPDLNSVLGYASVNLE